MIILISLKEFHTTQTSKQRYGGNYSNFSGKDYKLQLRKEVDDIKIYFFGGEKEGGVKDNQLVSK